MPTYYSQSAPNLFINENGNVDQLHHNHCRAIDYQEFNGSKLKLNEQIEKQTIALRGCITFFKTVVKDKTIDGIAKASAACALEEDKARLKDFNAHRQTGCNIM